MTQRWAVTGALILAELALAVSIVLATWPAFAWLRDNGGRLKFLKQETVSSEIDEVYRAPVDGPATLEIENVTGSVEVRTGAGDELLVNAHKKAWGEDEAGALAELAELEVIFSQVGNTVTVRVETGPEVLVIGDERDDTVSLVIEVPAETDVNVRTGFGDIAVSGTSGDADLHTGAGAIDVDNVDGRLTLESDFGDVTVEGGAAEVQAHSSNGAVRLQRVEAGGPVHLASGFGDVSFEGGRAGSLTVDSDNGQVILTDLEIERELVVDSRFGDLTLAQVAARDYDLGSDNGSIQVDGASGKVKVTSNFGDISVQNGDEVLLDLSTDNGAIDFAGSLAEGSHLLKSAFGDIHLALPEGAALTVALSTNFGSIESEFPLTIDGLGEQTKWRGTINGGGPTVTAATDNGSITLSIWHP